MTATHASASDASRAFFLIAALIALSHLANEWVKAPIPWGPAWKATGIALLGLYALRQHALSLGLGLLLSSVGDVLLELDGLFVGGMAAFGLAHICYIVAFANVIRARGLNRAGIPLAAAVLAISIALAIWLNPGMAKMGLMIPATIYQVIISIMVITALLSRAPLMAKAGAAIFMLSDTLIATGMFASIPAPTGSVWLTYAAAQIMLAWSMTQQQATRP